MTLETLYYITQIIAVLAILGSLIAIWFQMHQNQRVERANGQRELLMRASDWFNANRDDPALFETLARLMQDYNNAAPVDQGRFSSWGFELLFMVESAMYMHRDGFLNEKSYDGFLQGALALVKTPGGQQWYAGAQHIWGADAVAELEQRMAEIGYQVPPWNELRPEFGRHMKYRQRDVASAS
ncbi:MAG: hypothetical protein AAF642_04635 [Pseudomonadota bacterium]